MENETPIERKIRIIETYVPICRKAKADGNAIIIATDDGKSIRLDAPAEKLQDLLRQIREAWLNL